MFDETIAAIATPLGQGGLAIIRISGDKALADCRFPVRSRRQIKSHLAKAKSHTLHYGHIVRDERRLDEVMVSVMKAPATFTREDVVEISCHGGIRSTKAVLDAVLDGGARLALPGEFTKRAFLHGRIDLTQAEAVADLIHARTDLALSAANEQLAGKLSQRINQLRDDLMHVLAHVEAHIDFPDEDIEPDTMNGLITRLENAGRFIDELLATANEGQLIRRGIRVAIIGRPNAGKSSLLNQLLGRDRAIVSAVAGTTRDTISEEAQIRGIAVVFIDTAGLQESGDAIEREGIRRSRESLGQADHCAACAGRLRATHHGRRDVPGRVRRQATHPRAEQERPAKSTWPERRPADSPSVSVCCLDGQGIEALKDAIRNRSGTGKITSEMLEVMINSRHQEALRRAADFTPNSTLEQLRADTPLDLVAVDLSE